ncbi:MAG TPA: hypothetical protein VGV90_05605 [Solirubrobacteraceae bacterium]|nr:hypothetical protein [Solirubrobacteraceae bacterium]
MTSDATASTKPRRGGLGSRKWLAATICLLAFVAFPPAAQALEQNITPADGETNDEFGTSVAIDGDTAVIGAPRHASATAAGAVYVFKRTGDIWTQTAKLTASDGQSGDRLGTSVAIDGDTIVAGAWRAGDGAGAVYTFTRTGAAARTETAKLTASDPASQGLGFSVAIDGDTIVAGAHLDDMSRGAVYTFVTTGPAHRTETAKLTASDGAAGDRLGIDVAIDGDTIVASADGDQVGENANQGSVYTFARAGTAARSEIAKLTVSDGEAGDGLSAVAIDGDTIVAGAPFAGGGPTLPVKPNSPCEACQDESPGAVYTFARAGAPARNETAKLTASRGSPRDRLGVAVAIDGDTIVAGARGHRDARGYVYTFTRTGASMRTETATLVHADGIGYDDEFALSRERWVAIDGETIIAGFPDDESGERTGSALIFFPAASAPRCDGKSATMTGSGTVTGTAGDDVIVTGDGADRVDGRGGNDTICARGGNDQVRGGDGNDRVLGGHGNDALRGDRGNDALRGGDGADSLRGDDGNDSVRGGDDDDFLQGNDDDDSMNGGDGADRVRGGTGDDALLGGSGEDDLDGSSGHDAIDGGRHDDRVNGNAGNDLIRGGLGDDFLQGERGNDTAKGGAGDDVIFGADGDDELSGGDGDDTISGGAGADTISGGPGRDRINGSAGGDGIDGGAGDDRIDGGPGNDTINGGRGDDRINGGAGSDSCSNAEDVQGCVGTPSGP